MRFDSYGRSPAAPWSLFFKDVDKCCSQKAHEKVLMEKDNWKWWYCMVAGLLSGAYGGYELYSGMIKKGWGARF